jgi:hypothetical protein
VKKKWGLREENKNRKQSVPVTSRKSSTIFGGQIKKNGTQNIFEE